MAVLLVCGTLRAQLTDANGQITSDNWLILGPFSSTLGCAGDTDGLLGNHIAPSHIACQFPEDGDEIDYDPAQSVSTGYVGPPGGGGGPVWRTLLDGSNDGDINLDTDVGGDLSQVMSWLATYVQYDGAVPTIVQLCVGSDDGVQVWVDDELVHNQSSCRGRAYCQDTPSVVIKPGVHCIKMGIWENAGGWGGSLGMVQDGQPIVDDPGLWPDWIFLGTSGGIPPACTPPDVFPSRIIGVTCIKRVDGGLDLTWTNPADANTAVPISIWVAGFQTATVPGTSTSAVVPAKDLPDQNATVCVVNSSGLPSCCSVQATTATGLVKTSQWLVLGPFQEPFGCNGNNNSILSNHIAPSCIQGQYPQEGDEIEYDPGPASTSAYVGPTSGAGKPLWRNFDDGSDNGDQDLDADVNGDQTGVMSFLATYIEYKGAEDPIAVDLCLSSDDGIQVWLDDKVVHNNNACRGRDPNICQDLASISISKGRHRIAMGIWENAGGWGGSLAMQIAGTPITDDAAQFPDWVFWGRTKPPGFVDIPCPACTEAVRDVHCKLRTGFPSGLEVTWTNPPGCDLPILPQTSIRVNGTEVNTVAPNQSSAIVPTARLPGGIIVVEVVNSSGFPATCCFQGTDDQGMIRTSKWLVLGPFQEPFGCNGDNDSILGNHLAPSHICQQYPEEGDEIDYDPAQSVSTGYVGPTSGNGKPFWRALDDGTPCDGDNNLDADVTGDQTAVMSWLITYVEYVGGPSIDVEMCVGSDDGVQVWMDDTMVHNNNACRARGVCQDIVPITITQGVHRFAMGTWENNGGWGSSLGFQDASGRIVDDGTRDDFVFHGTTRPQPISEFPECIPPCPAVQSLTCKVNGDGSLSLSWENPVCDNANGNITILVNGSQVGSVPAAATSFTVPPASVPDGIVDVVIDNSAIKPGHCGVLTGEELYINCGGDEFTDTLGRVWTTDTLVSPSPFLSSANFATADFLNPGLVNLTADPVVAAQQFPAEIMPVERWNDGPVEYTVASMSPGDYELTLLFMEGCCSDGCEDIPDPQASAGSCRVFDIYVNDQLVEDQFSQNVIASQEAGVAPGATANYIAIARVYQLSGISSLKVLIDDLGQGTPPENASIKGICLVKSGGGGGRNFHRGDADDNGQLQLTDAIRVLGFLFLGGQEPGCLDAADADDNGQLQLTDAIRILGYLFLGGVPPAPPGPPTDPCGKDTGDVSLGCNSYQSC